MDFKKLLETPIFAILWLFFTCGLLFLVRIFNLTTEPLIESIQVIKRPDSQEIPQR